MKQIIQTLLFINFSINSSAQIISIEKIKEVPQTAIYSAKDSVLIFPVFKMKNKRIENKINQKLQDDFKKERDIDKREHNMRSILKKASQEGLTDIDFEIIYQTQKIISFSFQLGGMGAYPTSWQTQYCFNLETGNLITLDSLIKRNYMKDFLSLVKKRLSSHIKAYKKDLLNQLHKKEIDLETYNWVLDEMKDNCWSYYNPQKFTINKTSITVIIDCEFPHAIQALLPDSDIKLQFNQIGLYLNKKNKYLN